jgi:ATP-dependent DNA helicase RecG
VQTSCIRRRPQGRKPVATEVLSRDARALAYDAIRAAVADGHQAYIVCPLVGLSSEQRAEAGADGSLERSIAAGRDVTSLKAAEDEAAYLSRSVFPDFSVGLLTGGMPAADKRRMMEEFAAGDIAVLVATTVVEVGVDVPNATVMMVEDAERFGLAQLHQLRGRVGRGSAAGRFFLIADPGKDDEKLAARLDALCSTDDGFELARLDLESRREGNVFGALQHGASVLRLVDVTRDAGLVQAAHAEAASLLDADPELAAPEHLALAAELEVFFEAARARAEDGDGGNDGDGEGGGAGKEAGGKGHAARGRASSRSSAPRSGHGKGR